MWESLFDRMVSRMFTTDQLDITYPDGRVHRYGSGQGRRASIAIHDNATLRALCLRPELALGEAYMDGRLTIEGDDLMGFMQIVVANRNSGPLPVYLTLIDKLRMALRDLGLRNTARSARANVAHHYDISDDLYRLFLDQDMQYSCAYFTDPDMTLEDAQAAKKDHIARKLLIAPGMRVLDIGCGWGGMALTLARDWGARVTGVTLSENQLATARARAAAAGLADRVEFRLADYRTLDDRFDRIVSVGMLEHVGVPQYATYFDQVARLLDPDGIALIHSIGRCAPPITQSQWINRYIFPGGYVPSLSELAPAVERAGLWHLDLEIWRLHYAMTLRHWLARFDANLDTVRASYDARFIRMWRYYLTVCILAFEIQEQAVFHMQLGHKRDAVPLTRDYLYRADALTHREAAE
jgi:cyclopropane-fatty-acyl-phospholipid synthase